MTTILLPTDLSVKSLWPIHEIVEQNSGAPLLIKVVHMLSLPTSITDLLFLKDAKPYKSLPTFFTDALQMLQNRYNSHEVTVIFDFIFCSTSRYLNNLVEGIGVNGVYLLGEYNYQLPLKHSVNFLPLLKKIKVPVNEVQMHNPVSSRFQSFSALLTGKTAGSVQESKEVAESIYSY